MRNAPSGARAGYFKASFSALLLAVLLSVFVATANGASPDQGQTSFEQKCKACHTIGGGRLVGPDLKGVTGQYDKSTVIRLIMSPPAPMPNLGISQQEAENLVAYIEAKSSGAGSQGTSSSGSVAGKASPAPAGDAVLGRELFTGGVGFANGGVACVSCHNVQGIGAFGGGSLGKDLTNSHETLGQEGLRSIIRTTPFPVMREAYANHPVTESETAHLLAFLQEASIGKVQVQNAGPFYFVGVGGLALIVVLGLVHVIWSGRLQGVRQPLVKGGSK